MVGAATSLFPWVSSCSDRAMEEIKGEKARLGIIGTGSRGKYHITNLLQDESAEIVALCDDYRPHLDDAAAMCPKAKLYEDYRRLLDDKEVDGVIICTPLSLHAPITIDSLSAGKHTFCEKAMAYSKEQCQAIYSFWKSTDRVLMIGQQRMYDPKYIKAMELVQSGAIGQVVSIRNYWYRNNDWRRPVPSPELEHRINWRLYNETSRGLMTELACHQLHNGTWSTGLLPESVIGTGSIIYWKDGREVFDNVHTIYQYPDGRSMTFDSVISNKHFGMGEQILGTDGTIDLVAGIMYSEQPRDHSGLYQFLKQIEEGIMSNSAFAGSSWAQESASKDKGVRFIDNVVLNSGESTVGATADGSAELMHAFCHAIITGKQPEKIVTEAFNSTMMALEGDRATHTGERILFNDCFIK